MEELVIALATLAVKYGPEVVPPIIEAFKKKDATIEDVEKAFAPLKKYEDYNIPDAPAAAAAK